MREASPGPPAIPEVTIGELIGRYSVLLLDSYGVLNAGGEALPGAVELIASLNAAERAYLILTNDASRRPETVARRLHGMGLAVPAARVITSGSLIGSYFEEHSLRGARCVVLGPEDSLLTVAEAGGQVIAAGSAGTVDVVVICDEAGYPLLETIDATLSLIFHNTDAGRPPLLLLPNPDLIYPAAGGRYGITAGSIAAVLEGALALRYPDRPELRFERLGKPHLAIFREAEQRAGTASLVMIGDQLGTDIRGAAAYGIDSGLVVSGLSRALPAFAGGTPLPTYLIRSLEL